MTKTTIISICIILVFGMLLFFITKDNSSQKSNNSEIDVSYEEFSGKKMAFSEFLEQNKESYQCVVYQYIDEDMTQTTEGLVFLSNGKVRGNFTTNVSGMNIVSSIIIKDNNTYTWSDIAPFGVKTKIKEFNTQENHTGTTNLNGTYIWNEKQIGDYDCQDWVVDESVFEVPSSVTFQEL